MSEKYLNNRLKYHAASRVASQQGQALLQALTLDGHSVNTTKVWASNNFPVNTIEWKTKKDGYAATQDLVAVFKALQGTVSTAVTGGGTKYTNPNYDVTLYENVLMTTVEGSNGSGSNYEAYEFKENGLRVQDWVSPMAAFDPSINAPIPGFTGMFDATTATTDSGWKALEEDSAWALAAGTWQFMYIGGILTFNKDYTPTDKGYKQIRMTAFAYTGKYLDTVIEDIISGGGSSASGITDLSGKFNDFVTGLTSLEAIKLSGDLSGKTFYLGLAPSSALAQSDDGLKSTLKIAKLGTPTASGYAASYQLQDAEGNVFGDTIDIVKDQVLKDVVFIPSATEEDVTKSGGTVAVGDPCVKFTFTTHGDDKVVYVNLKNLVDTYTGVSGVVVNGYTISGQFDGSSDGFFTLGANGFKVAGVSAAIDAAEAAAKAYTDVASGYTINAGSFANHTVTLTRKNGELTSVTVPGIAASGEIISGLTFASHTLTATDKAGNTLAAVGIGADSQVAKSGSFADHTVTFKNSESTELFTVGGIAASGEIISGGTFDRSTGTLTLNAKDSANSFDVTGLIKESDISALASGKMDKLLAANEDQIITVSGDGNAKASGYKINGTVTLTDNSTYIPSQHVVSGFVVGKINSLNLTEVYTAGKPIVKISETNGVVSAEAGTITADNVTYKTVTVSAQLDTLTNALADYTAANAVKTKFESVDQAITDQETARKAADDVICGAVSGAWSSSEIVIGTAAGIAKSGYTLNAATALTDSQTLIPSQKVVKDYVDKASGDATKGLTALSAALTGYLGVSAVVNEFTTVKESITAETIARRADDEYISGAISGFNANNTVSAAIKAVSDKVEGLDYNLPTETGKFVNHIEQVDGKVSGTLAEVTSDIVKYGASSNVSAEIAKIEGADTVDGSIAKAVKDQKTRAEGVETFISGVLKDFTTEGSVSAAIKAVEEAAISVSGSNAVTVTPNGTNRQISLKLASNSGLKIDSTGLSSTIYLRGVTPAIPSAYASAYQLQDADGNVLGDTINIAKDQFLSGVQLVEDETIPGNFTLRFTFKLANDNPSTIDVPLSGMFHEYVGKSGVAVGKDGNSFTISGVVDSAANGNEFLSVSKDGFKVSGVSTAISTASGYILNSGSFANHTVTLTRKNGADAVTINGIAASGEILSGGTFDRSTGKLTLTDKNGSNLEVTGLIKEGDISALASGKMDKLAAANVDEIVIVSGDGNAKNSGFKLGTDTDVLTGGTIAESTVATEKAVKTALGNLKDYADATFMNEMAAAAENQIILGGAAADTVKGSGFTLGTDTDVLTGTVTANKVATEQAVKTYVETMLTWETLV